MFASWVAMSRILYRFIALWLVSRFVLVGLKDLEIIVLRHQLIVLRRQIEIGRSQTAWTRWSNVHLCQIRVTKPI
jgi:hypothetical protein